MSDLRWIDPSCARETLDRWLELGDGQPMREYKAPAIAHLSCGHQRPVNERLDPGDSCICPLGCAAATVTALELLDEPEWFPHPDALVDLPSPR